MGSFRTAQRANDFARRATRAGLRVIYTGQVPTWSGGSTHPGGGLPMVTSSARIVADQIGPA